jgi:hypothetical protein
MTRDLMKILKGKIIAWDQDWDMKLLVWAVCTLAFHGAFRIHELLCQTESFFDPQYTLLTENLTRSTDSSGKGILHIKLNGPKEQRNGKAVIVDVFESSDSICPVKAFGKWATRQPPASGMPLFRQPDGTPLTGLKLNSILDTLMGEEAKAIHTLSYIVCLQPAGGGRLALLVALPPRPRGGHSPGSPPAHSGWSGALAAGSNM